MGKTSRNGSISRVREVRLALVAQILQRGGTVSCQDLTEELEVSRATVMRDIEVLRDQLNMPIAYDRAENGYFLAKHQQQTGPQHELPGLWLSESYALSILAMVNICLAIDPGILAHALPIRSLFKKVAGLDASNPAPVTEKIAVELPWERLYRPEVFQPISAALYANRLLEITLARADAVPVHFLPLRFALTLDGWYLDAYDSAAGAVIRFAMGTLRSARVIEGFEVRPRWDSDIQEWLDDRGRTLPVQRVERNGPGWEDLPAPRAEQAEAQRRDA